MTEYKHTMTIIVPETLMSAANQLALIAGESPDDVNTFTAASYQDSEGNLYAVCSTVIKPIVLSLLNQSIGESVLKADGADILLAQQAMDVAVLYAEGLTATTDKIVIAIDDDPMQVFEALGLSLININMDDDFLS